MSDRLAEQMRAAHAAAADASISALDRSEMLMEMAMDLQQQPNTPAHLPAAVALYEQALALCPPPEELLRARITARKATALQALPEEGTTSLEAARAAYEAAMPVLCAQGTAAEQAEAEMNLGLVLQCLAGLGRAPMGDAIAAYQRALRVFDRRRFPAEFAILQNNLATAFLSMPLGDGQSRLREALAVQSFEDGLKIVNLVDHPSEYAMLQNNLGNALQYAASGHPRENHRRALAAYEEALKVRTRATTPLEYANTIANKANCLCALPDDTTQPEQDSTAILVAARDCFVEAREIFLSHGEIAKAQLVAEQLDALQRALLALAPGH